MSFHCGDILGLIAQHVCDQFRNFGHAECWSGAGIFGVEGVSFAEDPTKLIK